MSFDSRVDTHEHIAQVRGLMLGVVEELTRRAHVHDASKLVDPERSAFDEATPKLQGTTYGSSEYRASLKEIGTALEHHYEANRHHPEHFAEGIGAMNLIDLTEMLCDWLAATRRHHDGDIRRSIVQNRERFGYCPEIERLLANTVDALEANELREP